MTARGPAVACGVVSRLILFSPLNCSTERPFVSSCPSLLLLPPSLTDCFSPATPIGTVETISHCLSNLPQISALRRTWIILGRGCVLHSDLFCLLTFASFQLTLYSHLSILDSSTFRIQFPFIVVVLRRAPLSDQPISDLHILGP